MSAATSVAIVCICGWVIRGFINGRSTLKPTVIKAPDISDVTDIKVTKMLAKGFLGVMLAIGLLTTFFLISHRTITLPPNDISKLDGNAAAYGDAFEGKLYNGSGWAVKELTVLITAKERDNAVRWSREYKVSGLWVPPLETRRFEIDLTGAEDSPKCDWSIVSAAGEKP